MYVGLIRLTNVLIDGAITMAARHKGTVDEGGRRAVWKGRGPMAAVAAANVFLRNGEHVVTT